MKLLGKRIIVKDTEESLIQEEPVSGLILGNSEKKHPLMLGEVIAVGNEVDLSMKKILVNRQMAENMIWEGEKCFICMLEDIISYE